MGKQQVRPEPDAAAQKREEVVPDVGHANDPCYGRRIVLAKANEGAPVRVGEDIESICRAEDTA